MGVSHNLSDMPPNLSLTSGSSGIHAPDKAWACTGGGNLQGRTDGAVPIPEHPLCPTPGEQT